MSKETKLVHFVVVDGNEEHIKKISEQLSIIKDKLDFDIEFLVTNDRIQLYDVKYLLKELIDLYKREGKRLKAIKSGKK